MTELPVQTPKVTIEGKEYALSYNMRSVEWLEDSGITIDKLQSILSPTGKNLKLTKLTRILYAGIGMERSGMTVEKLFETTKGFIQNPDPATNPLLIAAAAYVKYFYGPADILKNSKREAEKAEKK
jgi:hypothetical protein